MTTPTDPAREADRHARRDLWDAIARRSDRQLGWGGYYHHRLRQLYRLAIPAGSRVLELGCGRGDLLAAVAPSVGVGVDLSVEMVQRARARYPGLRFIEGDALDVDLGETFDVVILSDLINDVPDVPRLLDRVRRASTPSTRVVLNFFSRLWDLPLSAARRLGLAQPLPGSRGLAVEDVEQLLQLSGFEVIRRSREVIWPVRTPLVASAVNKCLTRFWPFSHLSLANLIVARPFGTPASAVDEAEGRDRPAAPARPLAVSVIVPARNAAGNVPAILARVPELGAGTEIVFVEGHSSDDTYAAIERAIAAAPRRRCKLLRQVGKGKGDAVRLGFAEATGDLLMTLDADLSTPPEELRRCYDVLASGKAEFANGVRLDYPTGNAATRFLHVLGRNFFGLAFSWLLGQPVSDTWAGTQALRRADYLRLAANRAYFGDFDPSGDFDLLFGAAKLNLKIVDVPVGHRERPDGTTRTPRWRHGLLLLRMTAIAARRLKFV
jgi:ubiquinone/menaquinone biosynthesis C-methylase UbiE